MRQRWNAGLVRGAGNVRHLAWDRGRVRANAACNYAMVSLPDHHVGRILRRLDELGLAGNTLVVFASDHGDLLGDHGFWYKSLVMYEESMRVPLPVRCPGRIRSHEMNESRPRPSPSEHRRRASD